MLELARLRGRAARPLPVDEGGLRVEAMGRTVPAAAYVTPSHQFPLGWVLSAARRARLVALARERDFYIIEDDYDSEYRYGGPPLPPLHALAPDRVVYVGTFSKTLFPALRIGYAVVPPALHDAWTTLRRYTDVQNPVAEQAVLAEFLERRMMDLHLARATRRYAARRRALTDAVATHFGDAATVLGDAAGLHLAVRFTRRAIDDAVLRRCREQECLVARCGDETLLLGFGAIAEADIAPGVAAVRAAMSRIKNGLP